MKKIQIQTYYNYYLLICRTIEKRNGGIEAFGSNCIISKFDE